MPQIEVTFDLDANGILNVSAEDKSTGNKQKITITNDTGRLTKDQIEKMVSEAEKFKDEDRKMADRVGAKNKLEQYAYGIRQTVQDEKTKDKIDEADKAKLEEEVSSTIKWIENNESATQEEFEAKQKELEAIANPIMTKLYQQGGAPGAGGMPGGMPDMSGMGGAGAGAAPASGPKVEEVD